MPNRPVTPRTLTRAVVGLLASSSIALAGMRARSLTTSGASGAVITGTLTTALGGYVRAGLLIAFFLSSSALSRLPQPRHNESAVIVARGGERDAVQVLANGGVSTLLAVTGRDDLDERSLLPYLGALAAATGDTWATEVGSRSSATPRHVITGAPVPAGTSGGVTLVGTVASVAGGAFLGSVAWLGHRLSSDTGPLPGTPIRAGVLAGAAGSLVDSIIGATVQERRRCPRCSEPTERTVHHCGTRADIVGGVPGLNNDVVNLICSLTGAIVGRLMSASSEHAISR